MAHFAELNNENIVLRVLVVPDGQEHRGHEFLSLDLGLGGNWIQCSYNNRIRKQYPGIGYIYDEVNDVFIQPQPYPSWTMDENFDWNPPISKPENYETETHAYFYDWNEEEQKWEEFVIDKNI